ncbi:hypothetical protein KBC55_01685 [Patescibacteria group bacterium]|nr:hypothetical protein [Patescibacteria group bacterium]
MRGFLAALGDQTLTIVMHGTTAMFPHGQSVEDGVWQILDNDECVGTVEVQGGKAQLAILTNETADATLDRELREELQVTLDPEAVEDFLAALG